MTFERRRRLIRDDHLRAQHGGDGDHHPLAHSSREVEWIGVDDTLRVRQSLPPQRLERHAPRVALRHVVCVRIISSSCDPTLSTGLRPLDGSWKIIEIAAPRKPALRRASSSTSRPSKSTRPLSTRPGCGTRSRIERAMVVLPQPLSPTSASVRPGARRTRRRRPRESCAPVRGSTRGGLRRGGCRPWLDTHAARRREPGERARIEYSEAAANGTSGSMARR